MRPDGGGSGSAADPEGRLWADTAPYWPPCAPLEQDSTTDVLVIGAGYTGLSAALHLAQSGVRVTVLEARRVGHGGSGRNVGLVNSGLWTAPDSLNDTLGAAQGEALTAALAAAPDLVFDLIAQHGIACEMTVLVVDAFEMVEIGQHQGKPAAGAIAPGAGDLAGGDGGDVSIRTISKTRNSPCQRGDNKATDDSCEHPHPLLWTVC